MGGVGWGWMWGCGGCGVRLVADVVVSRWGSDVLDVGVRVQRMWCWSGGRHSGVGVAAGVEAMRWWQCS